MTSMEEAHRNDYRQQNRMHEVRQQLLDLIGDAPELSRLSMKTRIAAQLAANELWEDMQQIVRAWA